MQLDIEQADTDFLNSANWGPEMEQRLAWLQNNDPVFWSETCNLWIITRFEHVSEISKNNQLFCSGQGVRPGNPVKLSLIDEDEPRHTQLRRLINRGFTPRMVSKLEEEFAVITRETLDEIAKKGSCDFVDDIAVPLPLLLIAEMIGIRKEDREKFHQWSDAMIAGDGNMGNVEIITAAAKAFGEYTTYVKDILEDRRNNPQDDLTSILVSAESEGMLDSIAHHGDLDGIPGGMPTDELVMFMVLLLVAGNETTRNGISGGMQCLIENPEARQRLIDDPSLIPQAVEEMLRWTTPIRSFSRTATADTELGGKQIKQGDVVLMCYGSANHDAREFENPEVFDIDRRPHHVAFGVGNHFCLGANLARMEMKVAFTELLRRLPDMEYSAGGPEIVPNSLVRTCHHMYVKYTPES